jgi:alpha-mannosidase
MLLPLYTLGQTKPSFVEGYHGGVEGHFPSGTMQFFVNTMRRTPDWKLNLEIEPATWESERQKDPDAYNSFQQLYKDAPDRIEFVSVAYGQTYFWNIDGESLIRQFIYGMETIHNHFPSAVIKTYSPEEPCWTSAMPQILKSLGMSYAVLKNPNTTWGGYCVGKDAEVVNWIGPDGSSIPTVPRYVGEAAIGTRATIASLNTTAYIKSARDAGILHPVGMCLQDAGRMAGPMPLGVPSTYRTWTEYFEKVAIKPTIDWRFSQENIRVSLMWGAQVLQRVAQDVRGAENKLVATEKASALAVLLAGGQWHDADLRDAWRTLLLSQHHDCWIVPMNRHPAGTWAQQVRTVWVANTQTKCDNIQSEALEKLAAGSGPADGNRYIRIVNTVSADRSDIASLTLPSGWGAKYAKVYNAQGQEVPCQVSGASSQELVFNAATPSLGYSTYRMEPSATAPKDSGARASVQSNGATVIETDLYKITLDPSRGGTITSLYDKALQREFVDASSPRRFNEYRGHLYSGAWISSADAPATMQIVENGPVRVTVTASGKIDVHPFVSTLTLVQGQKRIDMKVHIDWSGNPQIGQTWSDKIVSSAMAKPFYNDRYKLQAIFPSALSGPVVLNKNAAYDVCKSANVDTFFDRWDAIKHNIIVNWLDINDAAGTYGLTLMSDHTTSYAFGPEDPLGLVLAYSGQGLWDRNYTITGPTEVHYALVPHAGTWDQAHAWNEHYRWSEPLLARMMAAPPAGQEMNKSMVRTATGTYVPTLLMDGGNMLLRLFNAEGDEQEQTVELGFVPSGASLVELDGRVISPVSVVPGAQRTSSTIKLSIPRFGVRTLKLTVPVGGTN